MKTLLVINSSGRVNRSITRQLTQRFTDTWLKAHPGGRVLVRDLALTPPPPVDEAWIAAAFCELAARTAAMHTALTTSETLLAEVEAADLIVIGTPIYNFGAPASLKAFFDQLIRLGRSFAFDASATPPYAPLLVDKPVVVVTSAGDGALHPGGTLAHLNFLEPHLVTMLGFVGLTQVSFVRVGNEEFRDQRWSRSLESAEAELDGIAAGTRVLV